eukprot:scaffold128199_cov63-Phaeocystis_antarctica.AAC.4
MDIKAELVIGIIAHPLRPFCGETPVCSSESWDAAQVRVALRSCSYPRSTKVLITAFVPFGLTCPRDTTSVMGKKYASKVSKLIERCHALRQARLTVLTYNLTCL